jgi:hypothetical protein
MMATHIFYSPQRGVVASARLAVCGVSTHLPIARRDPLDCPNAHRVAS